MVPDGGTRHEGRWKRRSAQPAPTGTFWQGPARKPASFGPPGWTRVRRGSRDPARPPESKRLATCPLPIGVSVLVEGPERGESGGEIVDPPRRCALVRQCDP